mmetsp:Transcript_17441/g.39492  ORF Transcript_17441/g.39492 Transcript_17441/m.39492 type:complete len:179 (-) Transcript_17441:85-621(-)|eukprot:CAMPEP_0197907774 /NCGR_PEP_ID=MMETSP1439-20131203/65447_1 /TAXON_ID=66791 /ORGANISM="Gonyaulax spinifera, Strain CCMP409" /LENGTH=178 /DNA_ID=CAMNT_0043529225 /DNA_START=77 /DNA_END=613 /DNA_ORIENTATION=-
MASQGKRLLLLAVAFSGSQATSSDIVSLVQNKDLRYTATSPQAGSSSPSQSQSLSQDIDNPNAHCSGPDWKIIRARKDKNSPFTFPGINVKCYQDSVNFLNGAIDTSVLSNCYSQHTGSKLSAPCQQCFTDYEKWKQDNCDDDCKYSWCSAGCLKCSDKYHKTLRQCAGGSIPMPTAC